MIDVVCGVILDGSGRILACRRPMGKHLGGLWEFPGGKVEKGENPTEALVRELAEELEIRVEVERGLAEVRWRYPAVEIRLMPFFCRILEGEVRPVEHTEVVWLERTKLPELEWAPADLPVIGEILGLNDFFR